MLPAELTRQSIATALGTQPEAVVTLRRRHLHFGQST